mmetsp:Transcript_11861/g.37689  ORF Transcript_11861/g.37689 Transcript_11861/m.37689 type:complete len:258 (+) Transcript_11861:2254-3027(+)
MRCTWTCTCVTGPALRHRIARRLAWSSRSFRRRLCLTNRRSLPPVRLPHSLLHRSCLTLAVACRVQTRPFSSWTAQTLCTSRRHSLPRLLTGTDPWPARTTDSSSLRRCWTCLSLRSPVPSCGSRWRLRTSFPRETWRCALNAARTVCACVSRVARRSTRRTRTTTLTTTTTTTTMMVRAPMPHGWQQPACLAPNCSTVRFFGRLLPPVSTCCTCTSRSRRFLCSANVQPSPSASAPLPRLRTSLSLTARLPRCLGV